MQYAVLESPTFDEILESTDVYAVPTCTAWLENITTKHYAKDGKQITFAALCKWPSDETKLSDYLEKKRSRLILGSHMKTLKF